MKWQCALLQRWLPEYPDGDLPAFWKGRLESHLGHCPACREEAAALKEVAAAVREAPGPDPGPEFWTQFSREMHLKLVRATQEGKMAPAPRSAWWGRIPYLVGVPALAALLLWVAVGYFNPEHPGMTPPQVAQKEAPAEKMAAKPQAPCFQNPEEPAQTFSYARNGRNGNGEETLDEEQDDLDATLAGMTDQEREAFLNKLRQHGKDGSCIKRHSPVSWA